MTTRTTLLTILTILTVTATTLPGSAAPGDSTSAGCGLFWAGAAASSTYGSFSASATITVTTRSEYSHSSTDVARDVFGYGASSAHAYANGWHSDCIVQGYEEGPPDFNQLANLVNISDVQLDPQVGCERPPVETHDQFDGQIEFSAANTEYWFVGNTWSGSSQQTPVAYSFGPQNTLMFTPGMEDQSADLPDDLMSTGLRVEQSFDTTYDIQAEPDGGSCLTQLIWAEA